MCSGSKFFVASIGAQVSFRWSFPSTWLLPGLKVLRHPLTWLPMVERLQTQEGFTFYELFYFIFSKGGRRANAHKRMSRLLDLPFCSNASKITFLGGAAFLGRGMVVWCFLLVCQTTWVQSELKFPWYLTLGPNHAKWCSDLQLHSFQDRGPLVSSSYLTQQASSFELRCRPWRLEMTVRRSNFVPYSNEKKH